MNYDRKTVNAYEPIEYDEDRARRLLDQEYIDRQLEFWAAYAQRSEWPEDVTKPDPWTDGTIAFGMIVCGLAFMVAVSLWLTM